MQKNNYWSFEPLTKTKTVPSGFKFGFREEANARVPMIERAVNNKQAERRWLPPAGNLDIILFCFAQNPPFTSLSAYHINFLLSRTRVITWHTLNLLSLFLNVILGFIRLSTNNQMYLLVHTGIIWWSVKYRVARRFKWPNITFFEVSCCIHIFNNLD